MKKALLLLALGLCLVAVALAAPDFSGTWAMNAEKTTAANPEAPAGGGGGRGGGRGGGMGGEMTIKQAGNVLTISRMMGQNAMESAYILDGAEHTATSQQGDLKYKAVLNGNSIHITGTQGSQRGDRPVDQTYTFSTDGKTLTLATVNQGQNGATTRNQVYDKK